MQEKNRSSIVSKIIWLIDHFEGGTKNRFAVKVGVPSGHLYGWLQGKSKPKREWQIKIAEAYGVSVEWLNSAENIPPCAHAKKTEEAHQDTTPPAPPTTTQPDATPRATRDTALLEQLLDKSHHTLDRYLSLVEQQQQVINNLSDALVNREETPQSKFGHVRVKKHHFRHKTIPSQHPGTNDKI